MSKLPSNPDALILDFGGVIYQIDHIQQQEAFAQAGLRNFDELYSHAQQSPLFADFECGRISSADFLGQIQDWLGGRLDAGQIEYLWNSILVGFPPQNVALLEKLRQKYRLYLLSNTNAIHHHVFISEFKRTYAYDFDSLFEQTFYSFKVGKRKPDAEVYLEVLSRVYTPGMQLLFIDDTRQNVDAAIQNGLPSLWLEPGKALADIFDPDLNLLL
jgi:putative hydrolase of the HAD superfamily